MSTDENVVATLDAEFQEAVKNNHVAAIDRILADNFVLVTGNGTVYTKADLLKDAAEKRVIYERQEDSSRTVRVWDDTAVVTALLWAKGIDRGEPFDYKVWFSDTYVRTENGWRYVFGQSSLRLPAT
jgi:ketosteroid isomerase-like protein